MKLQGMNDDPMSQPAPKSKFNQRRDDPPSRRLSVKIRRHYGAVDVEFGIEADGNPENQADQERLFSILEVQVSDMHDLYARERLPKVPALQPEKANFGSDLLELTVSSIVLDDRNRYKVITEQGTKYSKFGAAVLNEAVLTAEIKNSVKNNNGKLSLDGRGIKAIIRSGEVLELR